MHTIKFTKIRVKTSRRGYLEEIEQSSKTIYLSDTKILFKEDVKRLHDTGIFCKIVL